jgi:hypothetical protein
MGGPDLTPSKSVTDAVGAMQMKMHMYQSYQGLPELEKYG